MLLGKIIERIKAMEEIVADTIVDVSGQPLPITLNDMVEEAEVAIEASAPDSAPELPPSEVLDADEVSADGEF